MRMASAGTPCPRVSATTFDALHQVIANVGCTFLA
jgi:hypothetical protein